MRTEPIFPGAASLIDSTCTFESFDKALHERAPMLAWQLDADCTRKAALEEFFAKTPEQRRATVDSWAA